MIILGKTKSGKIVCVGTGKITSEPRFTETKTGKTVCSFYVCSDVIGKGQNKEYESYNVSAWDEKAHYAKLFEKGETIYVEGECSKDDYASQKNGKDEYRITASALYNADIGVQVANLQLAVNDLIKKVYSKGTEPTQEEVSDMFKDVEVPDFLRDDFAPDI